MQSANSVNPLYRNHGQLALNRLIRSGGSKPVQGMSLLSMRRPTKASSFGWGGRPERAVDGNVDGRYGARTTYHSRHNKNNWWQVDLQRKYKVYLVLIHNRNDNCCKSRINGAQVYLDKQLCGTVQWNAFENTYPINCGGKTGKVVRVVQKHNYLQLAEVQVFGTAVAGSRSSVNFGAFYTKHTGSECIQIVSQ